MLKYELIFLQESLQEIRQFVSLGIWLSLQFYYYHYCFLSFLKSEVPKSEFRFDIVLLPGCHVTLTITPEKGNVSVWANKCQLSTFLPFWCQLFWAPFAMCSSVSSEARCCMLSQTGITWLEGYWGTWVQFAFACKCRAVPLISDEVHPAEDRGRVARLM